MFYLSPNLLILALMFSMQSLIWSQNVALLDYTMQDVLAHNDYQKSNPFYNAYAHQVGVMEADLYFDQGKIVVAHDPSELEHGMDLEKLYLIPLREKVRQYGSPYPDHNLSLALMLDLKNESGKIMEYIGDMVRKYPDLFGSHAKKHVISIVISGDRPTQETWASLPSAVLIDGRLSDNIPEQLRPKIFMVSSALSSILPGTWDQNKLTDTQYKAVQKVVDTVHRQNLKIRFWGVPDNVDFWKLQSDFNIDIIGCDHLDELASHMP